MNQTTYKNRSVRSPIQPQNYEEHPARAEIRNLSKSFRFTATFYEDTDTLRAFPHIPGLIAVKCMLENEGKLLGLGHGTAIFSALNKNADRTILSCMNAAWMSAANSAAKAMDLVHLNKNQNDSATQKRTLGEAYRAKENSDSEPATDRQKQYLLQLASLNIEDEGDREQFAASVDDMTRAEASRAISEFRS